MPAHDPAETEVLRRFLADCDVPCPKCGYNLRGSVSSACPECGAPFSLDALLACHGPPPNMHPSILRRFLAERDVPCPRCAYNLRGLESDHCPECNWPLLLRAGPPWDHARGALVGLSLGTLASSVLVVLVIAISLESRRIAWAPVLISLASLGNVGFAFGALARAPGRRWLLGLSPWSRALVTLVCWAVSPLVIAAFLLIVRR